MTAAERRHLMFLFAERLVGEIKELPGSKDHPFIQWCHLLVGLGPDSPDEVPWCSSCLNLWAWLFRFPRSGSPAARSWLLVGADVALADALPGDVVIIKRGTNHGPEVTSGAPGHVFLFAGLHGSTHVRGLGGNQSNAITVALFPVADVLGVRRLG